MPVFSFSPNDSVTERWIADLSHCIPTLAKEAALARKLLRPVQDGHMGLTIVTRHRDVWTPRNLKTSIPNVVIIGEHRPPGSTGAPDNWRCAISAIAWARMALISAIPAGLVDYDSVVAAARSHHRVLVIETDPDNLPAWASALLPRKIPIGLLEPEGGWPAAAAALSRQESIV